MFLVAKKCAEVNCLRTEKASHSSKEMYRKLGFCSNEMYWMHSSGQSSVGSFLLLVFFVGDVGGLFSGQSGHIFKSWHPRHSFSITGFSWPDRVLV